MMKGAIFTILVFVWVFWCLFASDPYVRMERACKPVEKTGNVFTSISMLVNEPFGRGVNDSFMKMDYGCQYTLWRLFYEDAFKAQSVKDKQDADRRAQGLPVSSNAGPRIVDGKTDDQRATPPPVQPSAEKKP